MNKNLSQLKRQRQNEKRRLRNRAFRSTMRTSLRKAREAIANEPTSENTKAVVVEANQTIDKMVAKGLIHKNTAARYKSRLIRRLNTNLPGVQVKEAPAEPASIETEESEESQA